MSKKKLIWRTVRGNRIAFDENWNLVVAPKWFREYYRKIRKKKDRIRKLTKKLGGGRKK